MTEAIATTNTELLRSIARNASMAPSVHNTQPWRFALGANSLEMRVDRARQLRALDPTGRQLMISCGCALFNARAALAAAGQEAVIERFPDADEPDLFARLTLTGRSTDWTPVGRLAEVIGQRQTNRRRFFPDEVPPEVLYELSQAASAEDSQLIEIRTQEHRMATARLSQEADRLQISDPAYRAEIRTWTTDDPQRHDGVPAMAVPHFDAGSEDEIPMRDFDTRGMGWLPTVTHSSMQQCLLLLTGSSDSPAAWLRGGEALERLWLEATRLGFVATPLTQIVEVARTRQELRTELGITTHPFVLLRVGRASLTPASRRRPLSELID